MTPATVPEWSIAADVTTMRRDGYPDEEIAARLSLHVGAVHAVPLPRPQPQRQRAAQAMQLQVAIQKLMPAVEQGDRDAILTMLKVQQREANLLGLDAPKEVVSHNFNTTLDVDGMTPEQIKDLPTADLKAMVLRSAAHRLDTVEIAPDAPDSATS